MHFLALVALTVLAGVTCAESEIDTQHLQCLVCRSAIEEVENVLAKIDPNHSIEVGSYRLDDKGNAIIKKVPLARSEVHISEVLDNICEKMSDYVRGTYKSDGRLTIFNLMTPSGTMNPEMSKVDIIQDGDLNKSLKYLCEGIVEEHAEPIIESFRKAEPNIINKICTEATNICSDAIPNDDDPTYNDADDDDEYDSEKTEL